MELCGFVMLSLTTTRVNQNSAIAVHHASFQNALCTFKQNFLNEMDHPRTTEDRPARMPLAD